MSARTVRNKILDYVVANLPNIKVVNGYNNTIAEVKSGFFKSKSVTQYPTVSVYFGADTLSKNIEGEFQGESNIDLFVVAYLNCPLEDQMTQAEKMIEDLQRFLSNDESIDPAYTINLVRDIPYVQEYTLAESYPYLTGETNVFAVGVLVKINFINFLDQLNPYAPALLSPLNNSINVGV